MSKYKNSQIIEGTYNLMEASYHGMIEEVCVMLIDDDTEFVTKLTDLLKAHNYKGNIPLSMYI